MPPQVWLCFSCAFMSYKTIVEVVPSLFSAEECHAFIVSSHSEFSFSPFTNKNYTAEMLALDEGPMPPWVRIVTWVMLLLAGVRFGLWHLQSHFRSSAWTCSQADKVEYKASVCSYWNVFVTKPQISHLSIHEAVKKCHNKSLQHNRSHFKISQHK